MNNRFLSKPITFAVLQYSVEEPWLLPDGCEEFKAIHKHVDNGYNMMERLAFHNRLQNIRMIRWPDLFFPSQLISEVMMTCVEYGYRQMAMYLLTYVPTDKNDCWNRLRVLADIVRSSHKMTCDLIESKTITVEWALVILLRGHIHTVMSKFIYKYGITPEMLQAHPYIDCLVTRGSGFRMYTIDHLTLHHGFKLINVAIDILESLLDSLMDTGDTHTIVSFAEFHEMSPVIMKNIDRYIERSSPHSMLHHYLIDLKRQNSVSR